MDPKMIRLPKIGSCSLLLIACLAVASWAQTNAPKPEATPKTGTTEPALSLSVDSARKSPDLLPYIGSNEGKGESWGVYETKQAAEFGGRISDFTGNQGTWDTFVNMGTGTRLLEYSLDMHSPTHNGLLFDDLNFANFGYGGDPNNVSHFRLSKGAIYSFTTDFRRDQQVFDYNLLANPLNPTTSVPNVSILNSPHAFLTTRRLTDTRLTLFPVGVVRFTVGWSRVVQEGSSFSTTHQGTEGLVFQPTLNTSDTYTFGISLRFIPRTSINYDQFFTHFKGDTTGQLAAVGQQAIFGIPGFALAGGIPVSGGIPFNSPAGQPCNPVVLATGLYNPACNGFFTYNRFGRNRNDYPTEQFSFQSNYFKRLDLSGRVSYTGAEADTPSLGELFTGLITRSRQANFATTGGTVAKRISLSGDFGATLRLTEKLRLVDTFRYYNFRIPGSWAQTTTSLFAATLLATPNKLTPATCPPPFTAATCPQHNSSSSADLIADTFSNFVRQEQILNTIELEYEFTPKVSAYVGFRYEKREITHNDADVSVQTFFPGPTAALANRGACAPASAHPLNPDGTCTVVVPDSDNIFVPINGYSAIFGFSAHPTNRLRFSLDTEQYYADNTYTRITPRHLQWYKARGNYKASDWVTLAAALNIRENRNDTADIVNLQHNRSYAFNGILAPPEAKWGLDLGYDYNDIFSQTNICFVATPTPPGALTCGTPFLSGVSTYTEKSHVVNSSVFLHPVRRVSAAVGYTVTSSNGNTLILNPNAPTGPLSFNYHLPTASLAIEFSKHLTYKTGWNYYDYNEKSASGPTLPRDFRGNTFTLSLRYSM
jgi:hypothetical protein